MPHSPNFNFLVEYDPRLVAAPASAERALSIDDAVGALVHLRRFGEHLAQNAAAEFGVYSEQTDQVDRLRSLKRRGVDERVLRMFHSIRKVGNSQDPNDEPASELLERVKAQREAGAPKKKRVSRKKTSKTKRGG